jgi:Fur family peroxide stress response transcriptional regulator
MARTDQPQPPRPRPGGGPAHRPVRLDPEALAGALRAAGVKLTHQRLEIIRELAACPDHPDAETVFSGVRQRVPTVSLDTVYRTLHLLVEHGLLGTLGPVRERTRFDANPAPHHHFVCVRCGRALDFTAREFDVLPVPAAAAALGTVLQAQVELRGVCAACAAAEPPLETPPPPRRNY